VNLDKHENRFCKHKFWLLYWLSYFSALNIKYSIFLIKSRQFPKAKSLNVD